MTRLACALDVGISTTDVVPGWAPDRTVSLWTGSSPEQTAVEALGRALAATPPPPGVEIVIAATGVGASRLGATLAGHRVEAVDEIRAIGLGGRRIAGRDDLLVVSLGTGTTLVSVLGDEIRHVLPGSGFGGGALRGLGQLLLGTDDPAAIGALALEGERTALDLTIGDVFGGPLGALPASATAVNFGKRPASPRAADVAAALVNTIAEVTFTVTMLGLASTGRPAAAFVGKLLLVEPIRKRLEAIAVSVGGRLSFPEGGSLATARGALVVAERGGT